MNKNQSKIQSLKFKVQRKGLREKLGTEKKQIIPVKAGIQLQIQSIKLKRIEDLRPVLSVVEGLTIDE